MRRRDNRSTNRGRPLQEGQRPGALLPDPPAWRVIDPNPNQPEIIKNKAETSLPNRDRQDGVHFATAPPNDEGPTPPPTPTQHSGSGGPTTEAGRRRAEAAAAAKAAKEEKKRERRRAKTAAYRERKRQKKGAPSAGHEKKRQAWMNGDDKGDANDEKQQRRRGEPPSSAPTSSFSSSSSSSRPAPTAQSLNARLQARLHKAAGNFKALQLVFEKELEAAASVQKRFKELSLLYHPDKQAGNEQKALCSELIKALNEARASVLL